MKLASARGKMGMAGSLSTSPEYFTYIGMSTKSLAKENYLNPKYPSGGKFTMTPSSKSHLYYSSYFGSRSNFLGRSAQKHAVFVMSFSCTDQWFQKIPKHGQKNELIS